MKLQKYTCSSLRRGCNIRGRYSSGFHYRGKQHCVHLPEEYSHVREKALTGLNIRSGEHFYLAEVVTLRSSLYLECRTVTFIGRKSRLNKCIITGVVFTRGKRFQTIISLRSENIDITMSVEFIVVLPIRKEAAKLIDPSFI